MPSSPKTKTATLTRVRDNQRRCRARKREYVAELEQKIKDLEAASAPGSVTQPDEEVKALKAENLRLQQYISRLEQQSQDQQAAGVVAVVESHDTMERLATEIRELRETLSRVNLNEVRGDAEVKRSRGDPRAGDAIDMAAGEALIPINRMGFVVTPEPFVPSASTNFESLLGGGSFLGSSMDPFDMVDFGRDSLLDITPATDPNAEEASGCCFSKADSSSTNPQPSNTSSCCTSSSMAYSSSNSDTTLCSVAYELVRQNNRRGVDMIEIGIRLWNGFQKGDKEGEGCKVENKLLYSVLDYLSG